MVSFSTMIPVLQNGPIALEKNQAPIPALYVDFSKGAEVVLGDYNISGTPATYSTCAAVAGRLAAEAVRTTTRASGACSSGMSSPSVRRPDTMQASGIVYGLVCMAQVEAARGDDRQDLWRKPGGEQTSETLFHVPP